MMRIRMMMMVVEVMVVVVEVVVVMFNFIWLCDEGFKVMEW